MSQPKSIHVTKKHKLKDRPPYTIRIQELLTEYAMEEITPPPLNTQLAIANIRSINSRSELAKTIDKNLTTVDKSEKK